MSHETKLANAVRAPGEGASLAVTKYPGFMLVTPLNAAGEQWLADYANDEASWHGPALMVEPRYFPLLAETAIDAGMTFERDAYLN